MKTNKTKIVLSVISTMILSYGALYAWNGLTASDGDTLNHTKWNELVTKVTQDGKLNSLIIVDSTQEGNLNGVAPMAALHIRTKTNGVGIYTSWTPRDLTYPTGENFQVGERDGTTFIERLRISGTTGNVGIGITNPSEKLVVASDSDADFDLLTSNQGQSPSIHLRRSHGTTTSPSIPTNVGGNWGELGKIEAQVYDGSGYKKGAYIAFTLNNAPGTGDIPTNMTFATTPDGSSSPLSRMFIRYDGNIGIGTSSPTTKLHVSGTITEDSDERLKENIFPLTNSLEKVSNINGVTYNWKDKEKYNSKINIGVLAQDVEKVFPQAVNTDDSGYKSVEYSKLIAPLIEAIKELKLENNELKKRLDILEG